MQGLTRIPLAEETLEWKITLAMNSTRDHYNIVLWERTVSAAECSPWKALKVSGLWEFETLGHHRRAFARAIRELLR